MSESGCVAAAAVCAADEVVCCVIRSTVVPCLCCCRSRYRSTAVPPLSSCVKLSSVETQPHAKAQPRPPPPSTRIRYEQMAKSGGGSLRTMLAADQEKLEQGNTAMHFLYAKPPGLAEASGSVGSLGGSLRGSVVSGSVGGWVGRFFSLLPFVRVSMGLGVVYLSVGGSGI